MNTFLPYPSFQASAKCLDRARLNSQRREAWMILGILKYSSTSQGWSRHPATLMWQGYTPALKLYLRAVLIEWVNRGYQNNIPIPLLVGEVIEMPWWFGDGRLHSSHRANLLRKDYTHYSKFGWAELPDNVYFWPSPIPHLGKYQQTKQGRS